MKKGFIPPAPVGNAPSQFVRGTQTNGNEKRDKPVENPSHSSSTSPLSKYHFLIIYS
jgi:hypothetical protein